MAYQRFLDLQQKELTATEALKQASLDRVRGEIASMRSKEDLERITPLIWAELKALNVPFMRCGVFIMDDEKQLIESHLSSPDGRSLGLLNIPYKMHDIGWQAVVNWRNREVYREHWNREQFVKFMKKLLESGKIKSPETYQGASEPPESLDLHFVPFKQGMLYVGSAHPLTDPELDMVRSLSEAFSIAYARYEDFRQLEQAKSNMERAFEELKSTQTQLVHSEKMASLGELTAGIAHEIQNPLNFVNNFSEISKELLEEMKEEMDAGNPKEANEICEDVIHNLEKIQSHGQRASGIVKGMLQHSRGSSIEKEKVDINAMVDEYLRLAFHGFRAKDKTFNANFKAELDPNLPNVKVIPQEISRVFLNLISNAFYAVSQKSMLGLENYLPMVVVSTRSLPTYAEIKITDNGIGIDKEHQDKIFEPFFTTKPSGQGTGLGLSLSYDIVTKGHGGKLSVESIINEQTEFTILIPTQQ